MNYRRIFLSNLNENNNNTKKYKSPLKEDNEIGSDMTNMSDDEIWKQSNPELFDDPNLARPFEVAGLDRKEVEKYSEIIAKWAEGIDNAIEQLAQIVKFAAGEKLENAPGSDQFSVLIKDAPRLKSDLSAFKSQVEDLAETVKLAINDAAQERKEKIKSLQ